MESSINDDLESSLSNTEIDSESNNGSGNMFD